MTSFPVMSLPPPASYSPVEAQTYTIPQFLAFSCRFQVTSGEMMSIPGHFRSHSHVTTFPVTSLPPPASYSPVGAQTYTKPEVLAFFQVTSGHVGSSNVISCHVTVTSCELQPCWNSNLHRTRIFCLLQPLPGDFQ